jgi:imidazole glycerol-phosphate synthase subunit HisH
MRNLQDRGLVTVLEREVLHGGKPFLGICLGMQLLARTGHEHGSHSGLGWIDADVVRFESTGSRLKIPHMGWNRIVPTRDHPLLANLPEAERSFYFVHSYYMKPRSAEVVAATCTYGQPFTAVACRDNIFAAQFHPERSQDNGLQVLVNFTAWSP